MLERCLSAVNADLYKYQKVGVYHILKHRYFLLGDEQGLGKTLQAIAVIAGTGVKTVVVCPGSLRGNWKREIEKFTDLKADIVWSSNHVIKKGYDVLVVSYDLFDLVQPELGFKAIILDECQYIKNVTSKRSKLIHEFVFLAKPTYCIGLSGTPITNNTAEFYSILKLLSYCPVRTNGIPLAEKSHYAFSAKFCYVEDKTFDVRKTDGTSVSVTTQDFSGVKNLSRLKKYLKGKYIRRLAKDQLDLPPLIEKGVFLDDKTHHELDAKLKVAFEDWLASGHGMGEHNTQLKIQAAMAKVPHTCELAVSLLSEGEKVVIFTDHVEPCKAILSTLQEHEVRCGVITGRTPQKQRQTLIDRFQTGPLEVLICSIRAASTGITLTAAKNLIFNDLSWVPADMEQAKKRIHRIGQTSTCVVSRMLLGSMDERISNRLMEKIEVLRKVL